MLAVNPDDKPPGGFGVELPYLVGKTADQATEAATQRGITNIGVVETVNGRTVTPMTMDWSSARLDLYVERGVVVIARFS
jgi:hypothetical protein